MNGHDTIFEDPNYNPNKTYDEEGNEVESEDKYPNFSNPMIDREPQDELDRTTNRESYSFFQNNCQYEDN